MSRSLPMRADSLIIDPSGAAYGIGGTGPVSPGAAQTKPGGGGNCLLTPGGPLPCTDAYIAKSDPSGNLIFGTLLGGPTNDGATSGAVDPCMTQTLFSSATLSSTDAVPGQFVTLAGFGIGPEVGLSAQIGGAGSGGIPIALGGVTVMFDGNPVPIVYAQSRQVNVQAPFELSSQKSTVITLQYNGVTFGPFTQNVRFAYPGLFRLQPNVSPQAYAVNEDGTLNSAANPAPRGSVIALWGTGFGQTIPGCSTGALNAPGPANIAGGFAVQMEYGGPVQYAGGAPTFPCGVFQINMLIPTDKPPGALAITPQVYFNNGLSYTGSDVNSLVYIK